MHITREDAIEALYDLIDSGIINEELEEDLIDIANCIRHEEEGEFLWGTEKEVKK